MPQSIQIQVGTLYIRFGRRNTFVVWELIDEDNFMGCTVYSLDPLSINTISPSSEAISENWGMRTIGRMTLQEMITGLENGRIEDEINTPVSESIIQALTDRYDVTLEFNTPIS